MVCNVAVFPYCSWPPLSWVHVRSHCPLRDGCGHSEIWNCMRCVVGWKEFICVTPWTEIWPECMETGGPSITLNLYCPQVVDYVSSMLARKPDKCPVKHSEVRTILDSGLFWEIRMVCAHTKRSKLFVDYLSEYQGFSSSAVMVFFISLGLMKMLDVTCSI